MVNVADASDAATLRGPWRAFGMVLVYNALLVLWLLLRPGSHALVAAVDNCAQLVGQLLVLPMCVGLSLQLRQLPQGTAIGPAKGPPRRSGVSSCLTWSSPPRAC